MARVDGPSAGPEEAANDGDDIVRLRTALEELAPEGASALVSPPSTA